jgi:hypothetical protein
MGTHRSVAARSDRSRTDSTVVAVDAPLTRYAGAARSQRGAGSAILRTLIRGLIGAPACPKLWQQRAILDEFADALRSARGRGRTREANKGGNQSRGLSARQASHSSQIRRVGTSYRRPQIVRQNSGNERSSLHSGCRPIESATPPAWAPAREAGFSPRAGRIRPGAHGISCGRGIVQFCRATASSNGFTNPPPHAELSGLILKNASPSSDNGDQ